MSPSNKMFSVSTFVFNEAYNSADFHVGFCPPLVFAKKGQTHANS